MNDERYWVANPETAEKALRNLEMREIKSNERSRREKSIRYVRDFGEIHQAMVEHVRSPSYKG